MEAAAQASHLLVVAGTGHDKAKGQTKAEGVDFQQVLGLAYDPQGRRDPFRSLIGPAPKLEPGQRPPGVAGFLIDEMKLQGILKTRHGLTAMINGPDNKGHLLRVGDKVLDGEVIRITATGIVFRQEVNDPTRIERRLEKRYLDEQAPTLNAAIVGLSDVLALGALEVTPLDEGRKLFRGGSLLAEARGAVPPGCTAAGVPARLVNCPSGGEPARTMDHTLAEVVYDNGDRDHPPVPGDMIVWGPNALYDETKSLAEAIELLVDSPSHFDNMVDGRFTRGGMAAVTGVDGRTYVVAVKAVSGATVGDAQPCVPPPVRGRDRRPDSVDHPAHPPRHCARRSPADRRARLRIPGRGRCCPSGRGGRSSRRRLRDRWRASRRCW